MWGLIASVRDHYLSFLLFRAGWSTTEQIFNLRILCGNTCSVSRIATYVFIDFKKALTGYGTKPLVSEKYQGSERFGSESSGYV